MAAKPPSLRSRLSREVVVVIALTVVGAVVRLWAPGRLGLVHFDEGIYALAGLWSMSPQGLAGIDPTLISYAPPGFPVLVGVSYLVFGVNDLAAILVSTCSGTLTIPTAAWLARRTFGPGAGAAAAAFAALSGAHVSFSRMALTDASFLFVWLTALGIGQRFLERPTAPRAVLLGVAVGLAQLFKYNGWISGAMVALAALVWLVIHPELWRTRSVAATWGWGLFAAAIAAVVYWPWFRFVDSHGGYPALLAHQRSYLAGLSSWPGHWSLQLAQSEFLSGGAGWLLCTGLAAALAMTISRGDLFVDNRLRPGTLAEISALSAICLVPGFSWWLAVGWICVAIFWSRGAWTKSAILLCTGWATIAVLTPFYHPYARLWLPVEAFGWLFSAGMFVGFRAGALDFPFIANQKSNRRPWLALVCILLAVISSSWRSKMGYMRLLGPSDSLEQAARTVSAELPKDVKDLRVFARPPLTFYLALGGSAPVRRQPDLASLLGPATSTSWALLDLAMVRQEHIPDKDLDRLLAGWVVVREIPTTLNPPTLLDIDPAAARGDVIDASAPIRLLRPIRKEDVR